MMTERPIRGHLIGSSVIAGIAARTARETPGVLRLEPTLGHMLDRLRTDARNRLRLHPDPGARTGRSGVFVTVADGRASIDLDVATDAGFNALSVAADLQERIRRALRATGVAPGPINVTIQTIERPAVPGPERER